MTDKLSLFNGSLRQLGERSLASLSENREPLRWLDEAWDDNARTYILEQGFWNHASVSIQLSNNPSFVYEFGYRYQYTLPDDFVKLAMICSDQYLESTIERYLNEGGFIYSDVQPIWIQYISNSIDWGLNYALWPESFTQYVQCYLAQILAPRFKKTPQEIQRIQDQTKRYKRDALSKDAMQRPSIRQKMGSWNRARRGGAGLSIDRLRGGRLTG